MPQAVKKSPHPGKALDIGGAVLRFMKERGLEGARLARLAGLSESEVYNILKNRRGRAGLKTLQKLLRPLEKTLVDLFSELERKGEGRIQKLEKEPAFVMEAKRQGYTIFSDTSPQPEFFIGRLSLLGGAKGLAGAGFKDNVWIFLRVVKGSLAVHYSDETYSVSTYQKLLFNAKYGYGIKNRSATEPAEALFVSVPNLWSKPPAYGTPSKSAGFS